MVVLLVEQLNCSMMAVNGKTFFFLHLSQRYSMQKELRPCVSGNACKLCKRFPFILVIMMIILSIKVRKRIHMTRFLCYSLKSIGSDVTIYWFKVLEIFYTLCQSGQFWLTRRTSQTSQNNISSQTSEKKSIAARSSVPQTHRDPKKISCLIIF